MLAEQGSFIDDKQLELAIAQAKSLPASEKILSDMLSALPNDKQFQQELASVEQQGSQAHKRLLSQARVDIEQKNWPKANQHLLAANKLLTDQETEDLLARVSKHLSHKKHQNTQHKNKHNEEKKQQLISEYDVIWEAGDLVAANIFSEKLQTWTLDAEVSKRLLKLQSATDKEIIKLTQSGQNNYIRGNLEKAIKDWNVALELEPGNEDVMERLEWAERFTEKYKSLQ